LCIEGLNGKGEIMTQYVEVPLSSTTYERVQQWAKLRQQNVGEAIATIVDESLADSSFISPAEDDPDVEREMEAYIRLHPQLKEEYKDRYVAIYQGKLIDYDDDYGKLLERIDSRYPDVFVWVTPVEEEPISTIVWRSPRFLSKK
jgi:hypothetical protein